eukprot:scaffold970_cov412-Prasinococcus_capsulatus_cf.AAC.1
MMTHRGRPGPLAHLHGTGSVPAARRLPVAASEAVPPLGIVVDGAPKVARAGAAGGLACLVFVRAGNTATGSLAGDRAGARRDRDEGKGMGEHQKLEGRRRQTPAWFAISPALDTHWWCRQRSRKMGARAPLAGTSRFLDSGDGLIYGCRPISAPHFSLTNRRGETFSCIGPRRASIRADDDSHNVVDGRPTTCHCCVGAPCGPLTRLHWLSNCEPCTTCALPSPSTLPVGF